ncbi:MAG: hypothetical protein QME51_04595 [Planctomycetota bacterium]|nr:hypothetical protein [Planctomycetota bacterium]MDI6787630.1 hypothetical protein [Planctomycetota bacterium]
MTQIDFFQCLESALEPVFDYQTYSKLHPDLIGTLQKYKLFQDDYLTEISCDRCMDCPEENILEIKYDEWQGVKRYFYTCPTGYLTNPVILPDEVVKGKRFDFNRLSELICENSKLRPSNNCGNIQDITYDEIACDEINGQSVRVVYCIGLSRTDNITRWVNKVYQEINSKILLVITPSLNAVCSDDARILENSNIYLITLKTVLENGFDLTGIITEKISKEKPSVKVFVTFPTPAGTKWGEITIQFVSNDSVKISVKGIAPQRFTFAEMGFKDRRKGDLPNKLWEILKYLAKEKGSLSWDSDKAEPKLQQNISRLRRQLKRFFVLKDDPFLSYKQVGKWKTKFKIEDLSYSAIPEPSDLED